MIEVNRITTKSPWSLEKAMQCAKDLYGDRIIEDRYYPELDIYAVKAIKLAS